MAIGGVVAEAPESHQTGMDEFVHDLCLRQERLIVRRQESLFHGDLGSLEEAKVDHAEVAPTQLLIKSYVVVVDNAVIQANGWMYYTGKGFEQAHISFNCVIYKGRKASGEYDPVAACFLYSISLFYISSGARTVL